MGERVSIIIPTTCEAARADLLRQAVTSALSQQGVLTELIVVVNGARFDAALLQELQQRPGVMVLQIAEGNVSVARLHGLRHSRGEFFGFLDDDDELLDGALARRAALFDAQTDVVVTNGYEHRNGRDVPLVPDDIAQIINPAPAQAFMQRNWFASPGSLFRAATVPRELFNLRLRYFEWTYLLFTLLQARMGIRFDNALTYRKREDNPLSVSKTAEYAAAHAAFLKDHLLPMDLPGPIKRGLRRKYAAALNGASQQELAAGRLRSAWRAHLECLRAGGIRFLPYTRHLLRPGVLTCAGPTA